ncbi:Monocopper oxidase-like protein SKS2 [Acorus calamus]|uniref:Monocopper oxidase-like protein SKS2 n=1 Tax=Acorus calamus TaxID=4465 RepID=A0AAV9F735_ACOCL|nr:Monocopper oxidase-like protein SKS2 [Acorus calamus]
MNQARSIKMNLTSGAARLNPQGSYHYNSTAINRTIVLENGVANFSDHRKLYTVNGASYVQGSTPLKLADYFSVPGILATDAVPDRPDHRRAPSMETSVIDVDYRNFVRVVFQNTQPTIQTWHIDGYSFFFVGTDNGQWNEDLNNNTYNMLDAVTRSTVQV